LHYPHLEIELLTNGLLLTPETWEEVKHNRFVTIRVSVDATTQATYEKIRKGGDWPTLLRNLRFLGALRRAGSIPAFEINMTVMRDNYLEVFDFVRFGEESAATAWACSSSMAASGTRTSSSQTSIGASS
jgi:MoaA/NifB/PqqE/SkfB family radical SAM enzyme